MAFAIRYQLDIVWVPDGAGPMTMATGAGPGLGTSGMGNAQALTFYQGAPVIVPGGDSPNQSNFNTAIGTTMAADLEAQVAANLSRIQAFATGGG